MGLLCFACKSTVCVMSKLRERESKRRERKRINLTTAVGLDSVSLYIQPSATRDMLTEEPERETVSVTVFLFLFCYFFFSSQCSQVRERGEEEGDGGGGGGRREKTRTQIFYCTSIVVLVQPKGNN